MERAAMRAGLRPWEVDRASPADLWRWNHAHYGGKDGDGLSDTERVEEVMRRVRGERR